MDPKDAWKSWNINDGAIDTYTSVAHAQMFHHACLIGYSEKAVYLYLLLKNVMDASGNPIIRDEDIACDLARTGHLPTLRRLEEAGFDILPQLDLALSDATEFGHIEMSRYLAQRGADAGAFNGRAMAFAAEKTQATILEDILSYKNYPQSLMFEIAMAAMKEHRLDMLETLLAHGLDLRQKDEALLCAALADNRTGVRMLEWFKSNGCDLHHDDLKPLQTTVIHSHIGNTNWLLAQGLDPMLLPQKYYDMGLKNKVLGDAIRKAIDRSAQQADDRFDAVAPRHAVDAPDFADYLGHAIRAGKLRRVIDILVELPMERRDALLNIDDLMTPAAGLKVTVLDIVLRTGQHAALFDPRLWRGRLAEMERLYDALPPGLQADIGPSVFQDVRDYDVADRRRAALKAKKPDFNGPR